MGGIMRVSPLVFPGTARRWTRTLYCIFISVCVRAHTTYWTHVCISGMSSELTRLPAGDANYEGRDDVDEDKQCARLVCTSVRGQRRARHADPEN